MGKCARFWNACKALEVLLAPCHVPTGATGSSSSGVLGWSCVEVCALLCLTFDHLSRRMLKWQLVAGNCLENLLVEHDVERDCLMQFPCSLCSLEMTRYSNVLFQEEWMCF